MFFCMCNIIGNGELWIMCRRITRRKIRVSPIIWWTIVYSDVERVLSFKIGGMLLEAQAYTSPGLLLANQARVLEKEKKRQAIYREEAKRRRYQHYLKTIVAHRLVLHALYRYVYIYIYMPCLCGQSYHQALRQSCTREGQRMSSRVHVDQLFGK